MASVPTLALAGWGGFGQLEGMVKASEIRDWESLGQWLSGRSRDDAVLVAQRAACRVLPLWGASMDEAWAKKGDLTALPVLRMNLT
ncbi:MAG: hypothetical protein WBB85_08065, partial [Albidovulum sp.]|uniref:hypothetical protein n=1 Tax=Albidovulum sp. TaxID=1872424 RepID=UPI003C8C892B